MDCPPLGEPVYVDREMWEKVVLNLLSNALKFTFDGAVSVTVRRQGAEAVVTIRDSGIGVPAAEMPRLGRRGRSRRGTPRMANPSFQPFPGSSWVHPRPI